MYRCVDTSSNIYKPSTSDFTLDGDETYLNYTSQCEWEREVIDNDPIKNVNRETINKIRTIVNERNWDDIVSFVADNHAYQLVALGSASILPTAELFTKMIEKFDFKGDNNYIVEKALELCNPGMVIWLHESSFNFSKDNFNPFLCCVNRANIVHSSIDSAQQVKECIIKIFDYLVSVGYDLHMANDEAFVKCRDIDLLNYFLSHGSDMAENGSRWLTNLLGTNMYCFGTTPATAHLIEWMINNGLDPHADNNILIHKAYTKCDTILMELLDKIGIDFCVNNSYMPLLGKEKNDGFFDNSITRMFQILQKQGCDLRLCPFDVVKMMIRSQHDEPLKLLIASGFDIQQAIKKSTPIKNNKSVTDMFHVLIDCGISMDEALSLMYPVYEMATPCNEDWFESCGSGFKVSKWNTSPMNL